MEKFYETRGSIEKLWMRGEMKDCGWDFNKGFSKASNRVFNKGCSKASNRNTKHLCKPYEIY